MIVRPAGRPALSRSSVTLGCHAGESRSSVTLRLTVDGKLRLHTARSGRLTRLNLYVRQNVRPAGRVILSRSCHAPMVGVPRG